VFRVRPRRAQSVGRARRISYPQCHLGARPAAGKSGAVRTDLNRTEKDEGRAPLRA